MKKNRTEKDKKALFDEEYIKLIDIRTNEHYGDIMMFLNERSPLSVKVGSRLVELFLLKKLDIDTSIVSAPLVSVILDFIGICIFFLITTSFL